MHRCFTLFWALFLVNSLVVWATENQIIIGNLEEQFTTAATTSLARYDAAAVAIQSNSTSFVVYVCGGRKERTVLSSSAFLVPIQFTIDSENKLTSRELPPITHRATPGGRYGLTANVDETTRRIYFFGGAMDGFFTTTYLNEILVFNADRNIWEPMTQPTGDLPTPRAFHASAMINLKQPQPHPYILVYGGKNRDGYLSDMKLLDLHGDIWETVLLLDNAKQLGSRAGHCMAYHKATGKVYVFGGENDNGVNNDFFEVDVYSRGSQLFEATVTKLNPEKSAPFPSPRSYHICQIVPVRFGSVWLDSFVVWGGNDQVGPRSDVWLYVLPTTHASAVPHPHGWVEVSLRGNAINFRSAASVSALRHIVKLGGIERNGAYRRSWSSLWFATADSAISEQYEYELITNAEPINDEYSDHNHETISVLDTSLSETSTITQQKPHPSPQVNQQSSQHRLQSLQIDPQSPQISSSTPTITSFTDELEYLIALYNDKKSKDEETQQSPSILQTINVLQAEFETIMSKDPLVDSIESQLDLRDSASYENLELDLKKYKEDMQQLIGGLKQEVKVLDEFALPGLRQARSNKQNLQRLYHQYIAAIEPVVQLSQDLDERTKELEATLVSCAATKKSIDQLYSEYNYSLENSRPRRDQLEADLRAVRAVMQSTRTQIKEVQSTIDAKKLKIQRMETSQQEAREAISRITSNVAMKSEELTKLQTEISTILDTRKSLEQELLEHQNEMKDVDQELVQLETKLQTINQLQLIDEQRKISEQNLRSTLESVHKLSLQAQNLLAQLKGDGDSSAQKTSYIDTSVHVPIETTAVNSLGIDLSSLKNSFDSQKAQLLNRRAQLQDLINSVQARLNASSTDKEKLENKVKSLNLEIERLNEEKRTRNEELNSYALSIQEEKQSSQLLNDEVEHLYASLNEYTKKETETQEALKQLLDASKHSRDSLLDALKQWKQCTTETENKERGARGVVNEFLQSIKNLDSQLVNMDDVKREISKNLQHVQNVMTSDAAVRLATKVFNLLSSTKNEEERKEIEAALESILARKGS